MFLAAAALIGGGWYMKKNHPQKLTEYFPQLFPAMPKNQEQRLAIARQPEKLYDLTGRKTLYNRLAVALPPYSGQSKNANPRVPPPFIAAVPRGAARIDWKSPTASSLFKKPAYQESYKRIHQMVYGTPTAQARRGQLQVDWGPSPDKGYPIHKGRVQSWLPMNYSTPFPESGTLPENKSVKVTHFDLLGPLNSQHTKKHVPLQTGSSQRIVWQ